jgi:hypothetical protein
MSVVPCAASSWKSCHRSRRSTGSSPTVGSPSTSSSGRPSSLYQDTRARWPPESRATTRSAPRPTTPRRSPRRRGRVLRRAPTRRTAGLAHRQAP